MLVCECLPHCQSTRWTRFLRGASSVTCTVGLVSHFVARSDRAIPFHLSNYTAYGRDHSNVVTTSPVLTGPRRLACSREKYQQAFEPGSHRRRYAPSSETRLASSSSTANQFMWNALRGASRLGLARSPSLGYRI